jgi:hypothetical protein
MSLFSSSPATETRNWQLGQVLVAVQSGLWQVSASLLVFSRKSLAAKCRPAAASLKRYYKAFEYEYKVKVAALDPLKRYFIIFLTLYLEQWRMQDENQGG